MISGIYCYNLHIHSSLKLNNNRHCKYINMNKNLEDELYIQ